MIHQTDPRFSSVVNHNGCYEWSLFSIAEEATGGDFDEVKLQALHNGGMAAKVVGYLVKGQFFPGEHPETYDGCYVQDAVALLALAGVRAQILMGPLPAGMWPMDTPLSTGTFIIQKWHNNISGFSHFVRGNMDGSVKWDPIQYPDGSGSLTVKNGNPVSLRLVRVL